MRYREAFKKLGYDESLSRFDWSSEKADGVCITIWQSEMQHEPGRAWLDTKVHGGPYELWGDRPGNRRRIKHLARATAECSGIVDVVVVAGVPGQGADSAEPWIPAQRKGVRWRVLAFDPQTGHFSAEARL
jgi:hypothetical protein